MAWNGSTNSETKPEPRKRGAKSSSGIVHGLIAGGVVVLIGVLALYFLGGNDEDRKEQAKPSAGIAEANLDLGTPKPKAEAPKPKVHDPNARPTKIGETLNGYVLLPSGRMHRVKGVVTNSIASRPKGFYEIFKRSCDNEIACYLTMKAGETLVGDLEHNGSFKKDFIESLKEKIEITEDDTPEEAQLKQDVIEARQTLKEKMDKGEDIEELMAKTREQFRDLMRIKMDCEQIFNEEKLKCDTVEDMEDLFISYNKTLEAKGIAPVEVTPLLKRNLLRTLQENALRKGN